MPTLLPREFPAFRISIQRVRFILSDKLCETRPSRFHELRARPEFSEGRTANYLKSFGLFTESGVLVGPNSVEALAIVFQNVY